MVDVFAALFDEDVELVLRRDPVDHDFAGFNAFADVSGVLLEPVALAEEAEVESEEVWARKAFGLEHEGITRYREVAAGVCSGCISILRGQIGVPGLR